MKNTENASNVLHEIFNENDPGDRYDIFEKFNKRLVNRGQSVPSAAEWVSEYTECCEKAIAVTPEIGAAYAVLVQLERFSNKL